MKHGEHEEKCPVPDGAVAAGFVEGIDYNNISSVQRNAPRSDLNKIGPVDGSKFYETDRKAQEYEGKTPAGLKDPVGYRRAMAALEGSKGMPPDESQKEAMKRYSGKEYHASTASCARVRTTFDTTNTLEGTSTPVASP
ncbi:MAG: hypothetical protein LBS92_03705 [Candidatus Methanoplasma sp.]|jgi:hypothetical protein|nr:hypothetical protein [Candidatus Methanoplasma sp.]